MEAILKRVMVALQLWLRLCLQILSNEKIESILDDVLLYLQLALAVWQIMKLTPAGAIVEGGIRWLLSLLPFGCLSLGYARLRPYHGHVFKNVRCAVPTNQGGSYDEFSDWEATREVADEGSSGVLQMQYLKEDFNLNKEGNKLFVNEKMLYYITDRQWKTLSSIESRFENGNTTVLVKGHKFLWKSVHSGGVMAFEEALDCIILDNSSLLFSDVEWFIPVNLSVSEEKIIMLLNLGGLFLEANKGFWLFPTLLSLASALLEFCPPLRSSIYTMFNKVFCRSLQLIFDILPYSMRVKVYSLDNWVENLKPNNDLQLKVIRHNGSVVIGGGARTYRQDATPVSWLTEQPEQPERRFDCDPLVIEIDCTSFDCDPLVMERKNGSCTVKVKLKEDMSVIFTNDDVSCNTDDFNKLRTFVSRLGLTKSGSLKSYDNNKVQVRGWYESIRHYVHSGFPELYELGFPELP